MEACRVERPRWTALAATKQTALNEPAKPAPAITATRAPGPLVPSAVEVRVPSVRPRRLHWRRRARGESAGGAVSCEVRAWTLTGACQSVGGVDVQARPSPAVEARAADRGGGSDGEGRAAVRAELALQAQVAALQAQLAAAQAESGNTKSTPRPRPAMPRRRSAPPRLRKLRGSS